MSSTESNVGTKDRFNVIMIASVTADGFIAKSADHLTDWTSREDKQLFVRTTKACGVMVMGSRTFATIGRALPGRRTIVYTSRPQAISAQFSPEEIETTSESPAALVERVKAEGAAGLAVCGGSSIYELFVRAGVVDELYLTIEPVLFGQGIGLFSKSLDQKLALIGSEQLNEHSLLLKYSFLKT